MLWFYFDDAKVIIILTKAIPFSRKLYKFSFFLFRDS